MAGSDIADKPYSIGYNVVRTHWGWLFRLDPADAIQSLHLAMLQCPPGSTKLFIGRMVQREMAALAFSLGCSKNGRGGRWIRGVHKLGIRPLAPVRQCPRKSDRAFSRRDRICLGCRKWFKVTAHRDSRDKQFCCRSCSGTSSGAKRLVSQAEWDIWRILHNPDWCGPSPVPTSQWGEIVRRALV